MLGRAPWMALIATVIFSTALASGSVVWALTSLDGIAGKAVAAVVTLAIAVPLLLLCARIERRPLRDLGLTGTRRSVRCFALGVVVTGASAAAVFGVATAMGWLRWRGIDWSTLGIFLLSNTLIAFALEAMPEELAFRGYVYRALRDRLRTWLAFISSTLLFVLAPWLNSLIGAGLSALVGLPVPPVTFSPGGGDPVSYGIVLTLFGVVFLTARIVTGSLWTGIAAHLTALTVQRTTLAGDGFNTGVTVEMTTRDAILLIPAYLLLTGLVFFALRRRRTAS